MWPDLTFADLREMILTQHLASSSRRGVRRRLIAYAEIETSTVFYRVERGLDEVIRTDDIHEAIARYNEL